MKCYSIIKFHVLMVTFLFSFIVNALQMEFIAVSINVIVIAVTIIVKMKDKGEPL